jgi:hypothetical protein
MNGGGSSAAQEADNQQRFDQFHDAFPRAGHI